MRNYQTQTRCTKDFLMYASFKDLFSALLILGIIHISVHNSHAKNFEISKTDFEVYGAKSVGEIKSKKTGNWFEPSTWENGVVPTENDEVVIISTHIVTVDLDVSRSAKTTVYGTLEISKNFIMTTSTNLLINGTFQINQNGVATGGIWTYGSSSLLVYNTTTYETSYEWSGGASTSVTAGDGVPANVQVLSGTVTLAGGRGVPGNVTVTAGGLVLNATSGDLYIGGNLTHNGTTWTNNSRAVRFVGTGTSVINTTANNAVQFFDYLLIEKTSGSVQIGTSTNVTINTTSGNVLQFLNAGSLDLNGRILTLNYSGGNILADGTNGGTAKNITSTSGTGTIAITNSKKASGTASGTLVTDANVTWLLTGGMNFGGMSTINGTLQIDAGGFVSMNAPSYGNASTLIYNSGTTYGRSTEWSSTSGAGYPANVTINGGSSLDLGNGGTGTARQMSGNLTVNGEFYMDFNNNDMTQPLTVLGNVTIGSSGTLSLSDASGGDLKVKGNWTRNSGGTFNPKGRAVLFDGSTDQTITASGGAVYDLLIVDKSGGKLILADNVTCNQAVTLTKGVVDARTNNKTFTVNSTVSRTNGWVNGNLQKTIPTGAATPIFEIGDAFNYTPVSLAFGNVGTSGTLLASTVKPGAPPATGSGISQTKYLDRKWTLTNTGTAFDNYSATFTFVAGDIVGGANTSNFIVGKLDGSTWSNPTVGTKTATSTQITGATSFSEFFIGEQACVAPSISGQPQASQTVCQDGTPTNLEVTATGSGLTHQWYSDTDNMGNNGTMIPMAVNAVYTPPTASPSTLYYYCKVMGSCGNSLYSNYAAITVNSNITGNTSGTATSICTNTSIPLTGGTVSGGSGTYTYLWESSTDNSTYTSATGINDQANYTTASLTASTYFRRKVTSGGCTSVATSVLVTVNPVLSGNTSGTGTSICTSTSTILTGGTVSGGSGTYTYLWESSTDNSTYTSAAGINDQANYTTANLTTSTYFRRKVTSGGCTSIAQSVLVTLDPISVGGIIAGDTTICTGINNASLNLSGQTGIIQKWQSSVNNGNTWTDITSSSSMYSAANLSTTTQYRTVVKSGVCPSTFSDTANVVVSSLSVGGILMGGNNQLCIGASSGNMTLSGKTGNVIRWEKRKDLQNWESISNMNIAFSETINNSGLWQYRAVVKSGACPETMSGIKEINVALKPMAGDITLNGTNPPLAICAKNSVSAVFASGNGGFNPSSNKSEYKVGNEAYQNYTEAINTDNLEITGGTITFRSTYSAAGTGCNTSTLEKSITIHPLPQPVIDAEEMSSNLPNDGKICSGDLVTLKAINGNMASPGPFTYLWNNTATAENINQELYYSPGNNIFSYKVTVTDSNNCSHNSERNITVWENPISDPKLIKAGTLYHGDKFTLDGTTSLIGSGGNPSYEWIITPNSVITDYNSLNKMAPKLENLSVTSNKNLENITASLKVVNGKECKNEMNIQFDSRSTTGCGINWFDRQNRYCESQNIEFKYKMNRSEGANNWDFRRLKLDGGATINGNSTIDPLPDQNDYQIKTNGSKKYTISIEARDQLGCDVEPKTFMFDVVPKPDLSILSAKTVDLKNPNDNYTLNLNITGSNNASEEYIVKLIRRKLGITKSDTLSLTFTKNANSKTFSYVDFADGKNELYVDQICYKDTELKDCCTKVDSTIIINVLGCSTIFEGVENFPTPKVNSSRICSKDTLEIDLGPIKFNQEIWTALSSPTLKVYLSKNNTKDKASQDLIYNQLLEYPLMINQNNNINISIPANDITADQDFYVWYEIQPRSSDNNCKSIPHNISERILIRPSPVIPTLSIPNAICKNASLIPLVATTSTSSSIGLGGYDYRWSLMSNINGVVLSNASKPNGYISIDEKIQESAFSLSFTQTNRYDGNLTCPETSLLKTVTIINGVSPNRSTIARYPGHVYFLEDTTANLCVQWGLANDNTFNNVTSLDTTTTPKVSDKGFAVFGNEPLTKDLESLKKYLWADTWSKTGNTCGDVSNAECVTRTYYNASLPPKGAPRSTPDTYQAVIYPNPTTGQFTVALQGDWADTFTIDLLDYTGRLVSQLGQIDKALYKTETNIDIQGTPPGMYLLRVTDSTGHSRMHKVVMW